MNVDQQSNYLIEHPYFRKAVHEYYLGSTKMLIDVLTRVQKCCIDTQIANSVKCFSLNKRCNASDIKTHLSEIEPPDNLNLYLPIVHEKVAPNKVLYEDIIKKKILKDAKVVTVKIERPKIIDEPKIAVTIKNQSGDFDYCTIRKTTLNKETHLMLFNGQRILRFKFNINNFNASTAYIKANSEWVKGFIGVDKPKNKCLIKLKVTQ